MLGTATANLLALFAVGIFAADGAPKLIIYDKPNQVGTAMTLTGPTPSFDKLKSDYVSGDINFSDRTESVWAKSGNWELYAEKGYIDDRFFVEEGQKLNAKLANAYSSARPASCRYISDPTTAKLRVSTSSHLQGGTTVYLTPQRDLGEEMRNKITSLVAEKGDWEMYEWSGYTGDRFVIKEGETIESLDGFDNKASSLRPICETYKGKAKCILNKVEVLDKKGELEPRYTGTEIIGSQSSGSCYGPAEHEIELTQLNAVEEKVSLTISEENEKNWDVTVSASVTVDVGFMGTGASFSAGMEMGGGGAITMGTSKTTETTTIKENEHTQVAQFPVPGAGILYGIVDRFEVDKADIPVKVHMTCPDGESKILDSFIAMKQVSFGAAHFWSLTGEFTKEACIADKNLPDCVDNVRKNFASFLGQKADIEAAFEACFTDGKGSFTRIQQVDRD